MSEHIVCASCGPDRTVRDIPPDECTGCVACTDKRLPLPRLEVREYLERPGAFYIAVGNTGRWIIDDPQEAKRIVAAYEAGRAVQDDGLPETMDESWFRLVSLAIVAADRDPDQEAWQILRRAILLQLGAAPPLHDPASESGQPPEASDE